MSNLILFLVVATITSIATFWAYARGYNAGLLRGYTLGDDRVRQMRVTTLRSVLQAIDDMKAAYPESGRKVSLGEAVKWIEHELGRGKK